MSSDKEFLTLNYGGIKKKIPIPYSFNELKKAFIKEFGENEKNEFTFNYTNEEGEEETLDEENSTYSGLLEIVDFEIRVSKNEDNEENNIENSKGPSLSKKISKNINNSDTNNFNIEKLQNELTQILNRNKEIKDKKEELSKEKEKLEKQLKEKEEIIKNNEKEIEKCEKEAKKEYEQKKKKLEDEIKNSKNIYLKNDF